MSDSSTGVSTHRFDGQTTQILVAAAQARPRVAADLVPVCPRDRAVSTDDGLATGPELAAAAREDREVVGVLLVGASCEIAVVDSSGKVGRR